MNKRIFSLVLHVLLFTFMLAFLTPQAFAAQEDMDFLSTTLLVKPGLNDLVYGPPIPQNIPSLASRSNPHLLKNQVKSLPPSTLNYKVKAGDSLFDIANEFATTVDNLIHLNHLDDPSLLHIDQQLKVPNPNRLPVDDFEVKNVLNADLTAYTAGFESTGKNPGDPGYGVTATGATVQDGDTIAVDPAVIPLGTKVYIEGLGLRTATDTGGAIVGNRIDVYMSSLSQAIQFGYQKNIKVYILSNKKAQS